MSGAPSVRYPVRRSVVLAKLLALGWLAGCLALAWAWPQPSGRWVLGAGVLLISAIAAARFWWRLPEGELVWDGSAWYGPQSCAPAGAPVVHVDAQRWVLTHWRVEGRTGCWLWLEAGSDRRAWVALRRALHARKPSGTNRAGIIHE